jgi:hypothetical protein
VLVQKRVLHVVLSIVVILNLSDTVFGGIPRYACIAMSDMDIAAFAATTADI